MELSALITFGVVLLVFIVLDIGMVVSLVKPGDERNQIIVWKASTYTLLVAVGAMILDVIENLVTARPATINPFIQLTVTAIVYFIALLFFKKRHSG
ncbi:MULTISPECIES: hypothetical protein [Desulfitobacterium]|uniref:Uncharacterized protein n=1 Tax=Desulfitobacterium dehalogenans (strain ATCC 51507 / DSM 9161 / JW/IU-DC1) TaxID=756499 RepID=I4ABF8_DESDJ|nr:MULTISPECIES: hypothetical protein [Desulfitobacterium]AFM01293.1 hypothetical protein Desde_2993 [Desulfitobacterium dehalogenans ATCC 51507]